MTVPFEVYYDEVNYNIFSESPELFEYETLEKLGEVTHYYDKEFHGLMFDYHFTARPNSKDWLSHFGRCGKSYDWFGHFPTPSSTTPFHNSSGSDHEYRSFTEAFGDGSNGYFGFEVSWPASIFWWEGYSY